MTHFQNMSGLVDILRSQTNGAADGTGIKVLEDQAAHLLGGEIPDFLVDYVQGLQLLIFGSYPSHSDVAPSAVFTAVFAIFFLAHLFVFSKNYSRGHKFWLSLGFAIYALFRLLGFALRAAWAKNILKLETGIASEIFLILPTVVLASLNLVLLQRIFTWRHPVFGSSTLFWTLMYLVYLLVIAVIVMTIVASVVPYLYLLSQSHYDMCKNVQKVSAILVCLYSLLAICLTLLAFLFKQRQSLNTTVYQPWWITCFKPTYFVPKNAAQELEESFMQRDHNARHSIRIIASSNHQFTSVEHPVSDSPNNLRHNLSIVIIALTSVFIFIGAIFRLVCTFLDMTYATESWIFRPVVMYCIWGVLETVVNVIYLVGRVDLRFYRPDRLPKKVRSIQTPLVKSSAASFTEKETATVEASLDNQTTV